MSVVIKRSKNSLTAARQLLDNLYDYDAFLAKLGSKDRVNVERHVAFCEASDPRHAQLWKRLACVLRTLADHSTQTLGHHAVQFFVADGKYRMQVFALEDLQDGKLSVFAPDELDGAVAAGALGPRGQTVGGISQWPLKGAAGQSLAVESLTATNTPNPAAYFKNMLGWNRKAVRLALPIHVSPAHVEAVEVICCLAAQRWHPAV